MSCTYLNNEIDSMFDNEPNDLHNDTLLSDKLLWNSDNLSMTSNDINWDTLIYDDISSQSFDLLPDKSKDKLLDFDYNLLECNDLFESTTKNPVKLEPTHTNSVSSSYLTDDCSPTSSHNNSPVGRKVRKRDFQTIDSSSEKSFALYEECVEHPPKSAKVEVVKREMVHHSPRTIYKLSRDSKFEAREPIIINGGGGQRQIVKIRHQTSATAPYIVTGGSIKSVSIPKFSSGQSKLFTAAPMATLSQRDQSPLGDQDCDLLTGDFYDHEVDLYADYKPRISSVSYSIGQQQHQQQHQQHQGGSVFGSGSGGNSNSQHGNGAGTLFQTPIPQSGPLYLTDEEKRTLLQENYPIPTRVPLTKQEERNLKKVRRKIKNKLSAQESRRKKKEYVDALEKKVEAYEQERVENKRRIETLENQQRTLQNQIRHYQHQLMNKITGTGNTTSTGLMLFMICFALILVGGSMPSSYRKMNLPQSSLISSSAIYYMGYGPARNVANGSDDGVLLMHQRHALPDKPDQLVDRTLEIDVIPRQSILLGEDGDDRNFEDLLLSYSKSQRRICGAGSNNGPKRTNGGGNRNSSLGASRSGGDSSSRLVDDLVMVARLAHVPLVVVK